MIPEHFDRRTLGAAVVGAILLVGAGAAGMYMVQGGPRQTAASAATSFTVTPEPAGTAQAIVVTMTPEILTRAGIETAPATRGVSTDGLRIPATVQPDAYHQVGVVSTSAGRVLSVSAELGQQVRQGDPLLQLHSPEVAETERAYVGKQADLAYARQQIARLEALVKIGAASQQELDGMRAQQTGLAADVEGARARLLLLGLSAAQVAALIGPGAIDPVVTVFAPIAGTVTARSANPGLTIDASAALFTIVDLNTVWIVGDVYERDLARARVGSPVTIGTAVFPGESFSGRLAYVDPQIAPDSRTARVRAEVTNPGGRLRLGMLMEMRVGAPAREAIVIPRAAVQTIGGVDVVYVADPQRPGTFEERSVRLGGASGAGVEVRAGIEAGEAVVTTGSFFVRAERDRGNLAAPRPAPAGPPTVGGQARTPEAPPPEAIDIAVTDDGFTPAEVTVSANTRIRLRFTRKVKETCATEVVFAALKIRKTLPLGQPVIIDVPPQPAGRIGFACGMNMYRGQLIIR